jgi:5'(3')-deoxyribonucleotidase
MKVQLRALLILCLKCKLWIRLQEAVLKSLLREARLFRHTRYTCHTKSQTETLSVFKMS